MNEGWYMGYTRDKTKDEVRSGMAFRTMDDVTGIRFRGNRRREKAGLNPAEWKNEKRAPCEARWIIPSV